MGVVGTWGRLLPHLLQQWQLSHLKQYFMIKILPPKRRVSIYETGDTEDHHFLIKEDGTLVQQKSEWAKACSLEKRTATITVGVVQYGQISKQCVSLFRLLEDLRKRYKIPISRTIDMTERSWILKGMMYKFNDKELNERWVKELQRSKHVNKSELLSICHANIAIINSKELTSQSCPQNRSSQRTMPQPGARLTTAQQQLRQQRHIMVRGMV